jgi:hypothetical protein
MTLSTAGHRNCGRLYIIMKSIIGHATSAIDGSASEKMPVIVDYHITLICSVLTRIC